MLPAYLPEVCITNHAHSGLTTESFLSEGHWAIVKPRLRAGDICLFQFGHNDQKLAHLQARGGYTDRLRTYIKETRTAGTVPVLITPLARNSWRIPPTTTTFWLTLRTPCWIRERRSCPRAGPAHLRYAADPTGGAGNRQTVVLPRRLHPHKRLWCLPDGRVCGRCSR